MLSGLQKISLERGNYREKVVIGPFLDLREFFLRSALCDTLKASVHTAALTSWDSNRQLTGKACLVARLKRPRLTVHRFQCKDGLSIFFSWRGSWLMWGVQMPDSQEPGGTNRPSELIMSHQSRNLDSVRGKEVEVLGMS
ncbi:uncharacterized protein LOC143272867 isoform X2 [Peromyscus maniculatus bairdii]|uniref:uncharacterized protein LOC143272867 isoform X2 n=1 Tax=Peromyscus maniculatus bairdii TaxID=230844 RepID=UPI003FD254B2